MKGSRVFAREAADRILVLLSQTRRAERSRQKVLRQQVRDLGFYISDWSRPAAGFRPEDFEDLVTRGLITIT